MYKIAYACGGKDSIDSKSVNEISQKFSDDVESEKLHNPKLGDIVFYNVWRSLAYSENSMELDKQYWIKTNLIEHG